MVNLDGRRGHVDRLLALLDQLIFLFRRLLAPVGELSVDVRIFRALFLHLRRRRIIALDREIVIISILLPYRHSSSSMHMGTTASKASLLLCTQSDHLLLQLLDHRNNLDRRMVAGNLGIRLHVLRPW